MNTLNVAKAAVFNSAGQVLILKRSKTDPRRPGDWDFPGGRIEKGEEFMAGVIREIAEETGLRVAVPDLKLLYARTDPYERDNESVNRMLFAVHLREESPVRLSFEHDAYEWVDIETALQKFSHPFYNPGLRYALERDLL